MKRSNLFSLFGVICAIGGFIFGIAENAAIEKEMDEAISSSFRRNKEEVIEEIRTAKSEKV